MSITNTKTPRVFYGYRQVPDRHEKTHGGMVKFQRMQDTYPNCEDEYNVLYLGSSCMSPNWQTLVLEAQEADACIVWNQDGVGYEGWAPGCVVPNWDQAINEPMRQILHAADHVFYQSMFSKVSADRFLGEKKDGTWEILYNAVDTHFFMPCENPIKDTLVLLLGGTQYHYDRLDTALKTTAILKKRGIKVRLIVTGHLSWLPDHDEAMRIAQRVMHDLDIKECIEFTGLFKQHDAPHVYQRAHMLLHTKYNDPCPGVVIEALACGLPVVYSASGGVPELVSAEAGIGIPAELSWDTYIIPDPEEMADAVMKIAEHREVYAHAARNRAVECFDLSQWLERHRSVFERLVH